LQNFFIREHASYRQLAVGMVQSFGITRPIAVDFYGEKKSFT